MDKTLKSESTEGATRKRGISQVMEQSGGGFFCARSVFLSPMQAILESEVSMESITQYRIITNNPLVKECVPEQYLVEFHEGIGYRDVLVLVRDLVHAGHRLYTHPLAGSVKPNETPYKSIVVSRLPKKMENEEAMLISSAIETFDKFKPIGWNLAERHLRDFRLIDYTLLCGALQIDALAGLNRK